MKYFSIEEMCRSDKANELKIANNPTGRIADRIEETIECALDSIREKFGSGVKVNSGFRCAAVNKAVGGSSTSAHTTGYAADLVPMNGNMAAFQRCVLDWATAHKFDQIILEYPNAQHLSRWIHVGWKNNAGLQRAQILYTTNGKDYIPVPKEWLA